MDNHHRTIEERERMQNSNHHLTHEQCVLMGTSNSDQWMYPLTNANQSFDSANK
jgi:hypothetical protein